MRIRNIAVLVLALLMLDACSVDKQRVDYKTSANQVSPLEIPPDLTTIAANEQYTIPGANGESVANYSDYSKGLAVRPGKGADSTAVLPELKNRHLEHNGMQYWIVVEDKAENVWPGVKAFWVGMGFRIAVENPPAGVMETDWLENHGNVPKSYVRQLQGNGKAIDMLKSEGIRDQYVTRLERSKDGLSTEIHISSQVMKETLSRNMKEARWMSRDKDPEIEIAVLQMLADKLGTEVNPVLPKTVPVSASAAVPETVAAVSILLKETAAGKVIQINEPFDRSWRRVGLALDLAHITTSDKDRNKGIYFITLAPGKGNKNQPDYQVTVRDNHGSSEIAVVDQNGKSDAEAARAIEVLYRNMANNSAKEARSSGDKSAPASGDALRPSR